MFALFLLVVLFVLLVLPVELLLLVVCRLPPFAYRLFPAAVAPGMNVHLFVGVYVCGC